MNILIKLTCLVGLVLAPILGGHGETETELATTDMVVNLETGENELVTATVEFTTTENGEEITSTETFTGTESEVNAAIEEMESSLNTEATKVEWKVEKTVKKISKE